MEERSTAYSKLLEDITRALSISIIYRTNVCMEKVDVDVDEIFEATFITPYRLEKKSVVSKSASVYVLVSVKNAGCSDRDWHHRAD